MSLKLGNQDVTGVKLGTQDVTAIYKGSDEIWSAGGDFGEWGTQALSGSSTRWSYFDFGKSPITFPTDNWTVEVWFKNSGAPNHGPYASFWGSWNDPTSAGWMFGYNMNGQTGSGDLGLMHRAYNDTYEYSSIARNNFNNWSHVAMVKQGSSIYFYINGNTTKALSAGSYTWGGHTKFWCAGSGIRNPAFGTFSNFRISNVARYPSFLQFTPPSKPFTPDANTLVLAHCGPELIDYSGNGVEMISGTSANITEDSPWSPITFTPKEGEVWGPDEDEVARTDNDAEGF